MSQVAERYAQALFDICKQKKSTEEVLQLLGALGDALVQHIDIQVALNSPMISNNDKVSILKTAMKAGLPDEVEGFFSLLAKNNRIAQIPSIVAIFEDLANKESGVMTGEVRSAVELSEGEKADLKKVIEEKLSRKVNLNYSVDKNMIGGLEARVGSYIFEDSIKSHMQQLNDFITRRVQ